MHTNMHVQIYFIVLVKCMHMFGCQAMFVSSQQTAVTPPPAGGRPLGTTAVLLLHAALQNRL